MKKAIITGVTGQDGTFLAKFLLKKGYKVFGTYRRLSTPNFWRLMSEEVLEKISLVPLDLNDSSSINEAIKTIVPDEIYNLAAQSFVGASFEQPLATSNTSGVAVLSILEGIKNIRKEIKFYQASTSELYGDNRNGELNEKSRFKPSSPYAVAKLFAHEITNVYRNGYNLFTSCGILFNHESHIRGLEFVTRKITNEVAKIKLGISNELNLGNVNSLRDWGYAPDYVEAMWMMLQNDSPKDYVIATCHAITVEEFCRRSFNVVDLDYNNYLIIDERLKRPLDVNYLKGDYSKAKKELGWSPKKNINQIIETMVEKDLERWQSYKNGIIVHWDAFNYPVENKPISNKTKLEHN